MERRDVNGNFQVEPLHADLLRRLQQNSFNYFLNEVNPANGLVRDKTTSQWLSSITATGMGLSVYSVGVARGFVSRHRAIERTLATLRFFASSDQSGAADSTGYKGFYFHFLTCKSAGAPEAANSPASTRRC